MPPGPRSRSGFTLLEILVALTLLGIGILGLTASTTLVSRLAGDGARLTLAATVATARFERLRALRCASATSGSASTRGIDERWSVATTGSSRSLEVQLTVTYLVRARQGATPMRTQIFSSAVPCAGA